MYNPFVTKGYAGPKYFCVREKETRQLVVFLAIAREGKAKGHGCVVNIHEMR